MLDVQLEELRAVLTTETATSNAPKYALLERAIERCIRSGHFRPGTRVPTELELTKKLPVGLGTIQRALNELAQRGLLVRSRKTGTFVADGLQTTETHVYRFKDPETGAYLLPFTRVLRVSTDTTDGPWKDAFGKRRRLVRIDRLVWVDQEPPALSAVYIALAHGKHLLNQPLANLHGSSWHCLLSRRFHLPTLRMRHSFASRRLSRLACQQLKLEKGTIGTVWDILDFSFEDQPILFQRYELRPGHRPIELEEQKA